MEIYTKLIPEAWICRALRAFKDNPMMHRRVKVGSVYAPLTIGEMEQINFAQKVEDAFKDFPEDLIQGMDKFDKLISGPDPALMYYGIAYFYRYNLSEGWHP